MYLDHCKDFKSPISKSKRRRADYSELAQISQPIKMHSDTGSARYGPVDYSGTLYVKGTEGSDYVGVVFGYQSNRKFYVVMWRKENSNFQNSNIRAGIKGVQLKVSRY